MLKERLKANNTVTTDFLAAEAAVDHAAMQAAKCVATMLHARHEANLPVGTGLEALRLVSEGASGMIKARESFVEAHRLLVEVRTQIGVSAYGDTSECPPTDQPQRYNGSLAEPLKLVAAA